MTENIMRWILMLIMLLCAVQDLWKKKIYLWVVVLGAILISICLPFQESYNIVDGLGGVIIGLSVIGISLASRGKIGIGDGILLCVSGLVLGFWRNMEMFAIALSFASIVSIILLIFFKANRHKRIPFIPFLWMGYIIVFQGY